MTSILSIYLALKINLHCSSVPILISLFSSLYLSLYIPNNVKVQSFAELFLSNPTEISGPRLQKLSMRLHTISSCSSAAHLHFFLYWELHDDSQHFCIIWEVAQRLVVASEFCYKKMWQQNVTLLNQIKVSIPVLFYPRFSSCTLIHQYYLSYLRLFQSCPSTLQM